MTKFLVTIWILSLLAWGQQQTPTWQRDVLRSVHVQDWNTALAIVEHEIALAPTDMDVRAWRARILTWCAKWTDAELEYQAILTVAPNDADNWMGLATVYTGEARTKEALQALDRAVELDPNRVDLSVARANVLRILSAQNETQAQRIFDSHPPNVEAVNVLSPRKELKHEIRFSMDHDSFNFVSANQEQGVSLISKWTSQWTTRIGIESYEWGGTNAEKVLASLTRKSARWGALTAGGATAHDNGVVPRDEGWFDYDQGLKLSRTNILRGVEFDYGQHWYWYSTARIFTINGSTLFYFPRDWTWSLGLTGARSDFSAAGSEWRPSGITRLGFPIANWENDHLSANVFFAVGTENFAQVNQIGRFSSQTYGGGPRLKLSGTQDIGGFVAYQRRTQDRTELSLGLTYALHF